MKERLQKLIAHAGIASRRGAEDLIRQGRVTVDGNAAHLGQKIDPETAKVEIDGVPLPVTPGLVYHLLYKPRGVVSTVKDPQGRPTVLDLVEGEERLYPVGRLDIDSEGLMILTNDGDLAHLLTHPRFRVTKTYTVAVRGEPSAKRLARLRDGIALEEGMAKAEKVAVLGRDKDRALLEFIMAEGKKREIRRMCSAVDLRVERLVRTAIGPLRDRSLKPGASRTMTIEEVRDLYAAAERQ